MKVFPLALVGAALLWRKDADETLFMSSASCQHPLVREEAVGNVQKKSIKHVYKLNLQQRKRRQDIIEPLSNNFPAIFNH